MSKSRKEIYKPQKHIKKEQYNGIEKKLKKKNGKRQLKNSKQEQLLAYQNKLLTN